MTKNEFKVEILQYYFPNLCGSDNGFAEDYAAIGAFLTRKDDVLRALQSLEDELRVRALENANAIAAAKTAPVPTQQASLYNAKEYTSKILTRSLQGVEVQAGFNQARAGVLLHNNSVIGIGDGPSLDLTDHGRTQDSRAVENRPKANLPAGVPKIIGAIHPTDFMVLLKHGYAFKDVGAESAHGEFTHRLQWYAIIRSRGALGLTQEPIDLYKKMWFTSTKGTDNLQGGRQLYMWMALFDCLSSDEEAAGAQFQTMAWSPETFNNPEFMNKTLTKQIYGQTNVFNVHDSSNLYVLRKLLGARQLKRSMQFDGTEQYAEKKMGNAAGQPVNKTVIASYNPTGNTNLDQLKNVVAWIDSL
jgi:hypothetical protein